MRLRPEAAVRPLGIFLWLLPAVFSCNGPPAEKETPDPARLKEKLIRVNKQFVRNQLDDIDGYIERKGYRMDSTGTGLRYHVNRTGTGPKPSAAGSVTIRYETSLLDGRHCYSSGSRGPMTFSMNYDDVPGGLREGVGLMAEGDKALFLIPSHLAYGLTGDGDRIPPNAALVMEVDLVKVE